MQNQQISEELESVVKNALQAYLVKLKFKSWDLAESGNTCKLVLVREIFGDEELVSVDGKSPEIDLRLSQTLSFGSTEAIGSQSISGYLLRQVQQYANELCADLYFRIRFAECRFPAFWVHLECVTGGVPSGIVIPRRLETSALSLIPKNSVWHQHYLELTHPHKAGKKDAESHTLLTKVA